MYCVFYYTLACIISVGVQKKIKKYRRGGTAFLLLSYARVQDNKSSIFRYCVFIII